MKVLSALLIVLCATPVWADSFTWGAWNLPCTGQDQVVTLPNNGRFAGDWVFTGRIGAGGDPPPEYVIGHVEIFHNTSDPGAYAVVGKADLDGSGGDYVSPLVIGVSSPRDRSFAPGYEPVFKGRDELHIHAACGRGTHSITVTIYYRRP